jgi:hypothetical protein
LRGTAQKPFGFLPLQVFELGSPMNIDRIQKIPIAALSKRPTMNTRNSLFAIPRLWNHINFTRTSLKLGLETFSGNIFFSCNCHALGVGKNPAYGFLVQNVGPFDVAEFRRQASSR